MNKVTFYTTDLLDDNLSIQQFEEKIYDFCQLLDNITMNEDKVSVPEDFFSSAIDGTINMVDYLYTTEYKNDIRNLLSKYITEAEKSDISYVKLYELLDSEGNKSYKALVGMHENKYINEARLYVKEEEKLLEPRRFYLRKSATIAEFKENLAYCFPNLHFNERVQETLNAFHDITKHSAELIRHLSILNDYAKDLYIEHGPGSDEEVFKRLKAEYGIRITGKGSNEKAGLHQCAFLNNDNQLETITCNPHTKLYFSHSDFRIYFNWGKDSIAGGKILVGHIGNHWDN